MWKDAWNTLASFEPKSNIRFTRLGISRQIEQALMMRRSKLQPGLIVDRMPREFLHTALQRREGGVRCT